MSTIAVSPLCLSMDGPARCTILESNELLKSLMECPANKKCFDCADITSPRYVCVPFSTFVCSCCANIHKDFGHSIKCLNVFVLTANELDLLRYSNNKTATIKWLAKWAPEIMPEPDPTSPTYDEDARKYIKAKYIERRWCTDETMTYTPEQKPAINANVFLSPPLMCPYMPPAYAPKSSPMSQSGFQQPPPFGNPQPFVDGSLFQPLPVPAPFQYTDGADVQQQYNANDDMHAVSKPISIDPHKPYYAHSSSPMDFSMPLLTRSLSPQVYLPADVVVPPSSSVPAPRPFLLSPAMPPVIQGLSRSTTAVEGKRLSSSLQQSLNRSASDNAVGSPKRPDLRVSPLPANKNIDKSSIRHKFRVQTLVNKMANLLSPKKAIENEER